MHKTKLSLLQILIEDPSFINWAKNNNKNDVSFWDNWIKKHPDEIHTVYNAKAIVLGIKFKKSNPTETKINSALMEVLSKIQPKPTHLKLAKNKSFRVASLAVAFVLVMVAGITLKLITSSTTVVHKTGYGETIDLKLPDGTSVVLNGNSEISYKKADTRKIKLKGEAYFKVKSLPATHAKFSVNTKDLTVEVYGTQFNVNTRDDKTDVLLDEGTIELTLGNGATKKMVPGELVSYSVVHKAESHKKVSKELSYSLWREGTYVFNNTTLYEVMKNIEHAYGMEAEFVDEKLKDKKLSGGIPNQNLKICLSAIEKSTGARIVLKDNRLLIFKD